MMGRRQILKCMDEYDALSKQWRRGKPWAPGDLRRIKRRMNKRVRAEARREIFKAKEEII